MTRAEREEAVDWFAMRIKLKMREPRNEAKPCWLDDNFLGLDFKLRDELDELAEAIHAYELHQKATPEAMQAIIDEAADVAAFAMMIAHSAKFMLEP